jgi:hypothetical protein
MAKLDANADLSAHIGARLRIKKMGKDHKEYIYEGILTGKAPIAVIAGARARPQVPWAIDAGNGQQFHFFHPDGWDLEAI